MSVLRSGHLSLGPWLGKFESEFARWLGVPRAAAVSSGTAGLHLAVRAAGIEAGDEVITSPFSFIASANAIVYERATPVFVDIDPRTLNMDSRLVANAVTDKTTGVLPVHIFGYPAAMPEIESVASDRGLWIVEDACESLGARHADGAMVGARGHMAVFGFYPNKQMTTGEGGMVACPDEAAYAQIASERNQGRAPDMGWLDHERLGFNYRLSDIACALGFAQLERLDEMNAERSRVARLYTAQMAAYLPDVTPLCPDAGDVRSWFVYVVLLPPDADREAVMSRLKRQGIASKPYLPTIHLQPWYREKFGYGPGDFPIAEDVSGRSLALPFFTQMTDADVSRVVAALKESF